MSGARWCFVAIAIAACGDPTVVTKPTPAPAVADAEVVTPEPVPPVLEGAATADAIALGKTLVTKHECVRCHTIEGVDKPTPEYDCVGCHREIEAGTFAAPAAELAGYQERVHSLVDVPRLAPAGRLRREWIATFLADTHDLRPNLVPTMPRFALPAADVAAIAAFLAPDAETSAPVLGDAARGREIADAKGCGTCHRMAGGPSLSAAGLPIPLDPVALALGQTLAPDLSHARKRLRAAAIVEWLTDPAKVMPGATMPKIPMTEQEVLDVAAFVVQTPLGAVAAEPVPVRLAVLDREVTYEEVDARIFHKTCRHCHSDPEIVIGDGGPGYSGGFGFPKRALDLNSYEGIRSGSLGDDGKRRSIFAAMDDGTPRIVAHLLARQAEIAGTPVDGVRGMPLGLPAVDPQDIQLLETWIVQGRKRKTEVPQ
jgi:cytochrome c2